jgi:hypothetical protein
LRRQNHEDQLPHHAKQPLFVVLGIDLAVRATAAGVDAGVFRVSDEVYARAGGIVGLKDTLA